MLDGIGLPAYRQIADDLRDQIASGALPIGESIPSTAQLRSTYSVSSTVVRAAVSQLRAEGLVRGQAGKAVYVIATPEVRARDVITLDAVAARVDDLAAELRAAGADNSAEEISELRRHLATIETNLRDLYGKTGHSYPSATARRPGSNADSSKARRAL